MPDFLRLAKLHRRRFNCRDAAETDDDLGAGKASDGCGDPRSTGFIVMLREDYGVADANGAQESALDRRGSDAGSIDPAVERRQQRVDAVNDLAAREETPSSNRIRVHGIPVVRQLRERALVIGGVCLFAEFARLGGRCDGANLHFFVHAAKARPGAARLSSRRNPYVTLPSTHSSLRIPVLAFVSIPHIVSRSTCRPQAR